MQRIRAGNRMSHHVRSVDFPAPALGLVQNQTGGPGDDWTRTIL